MGVSGVDAGRSALRLGGLTAILWSLLWALLLAWTYFYFPSPAERVDIVQPVTRHGADTPPESARPGNAALGIGYGLIWLGGLALIAMTTRRQVSCRRACERLAESLSSSESRLELLQRASDDQVLDLDLEGRILRHCSAALMAQLDVPVLPHPADLDLWLAKVHPDDLGQVQAALRAHQEGLAPRFQAQFRLRRPDGQYRWFVGRGQLGMTAEGSPARFLGVFTDITSHRASEAQTLAERDKVLALLAVIGDAVVATHNEGAITFMNPMAERLTGWRAGEALGLPAEAVLTLVDELSREPVTGLLGRHQVKRGEERPLGPMLLIDRQGREIAVEEFASALTGSHGEALGMAMVFRDVTEAREIHRQLSWQATHDALTGLISRHEFERRLAERLADAKLGGREHALLYLDLDHFKMVNDSCGHLAGDELLKQVAFLLSEHMRRNDTLARLGGDEFGALLEQCPVGKAREIAEKLRATLSDFRFRWQDQAFEIGASVGIVMITRDMPTLAEILTAADGACYAAKDAGRNRVHVHQPGELESAGQHRELQLVTDIRAALGQDRLLLYAQEVQPLAAGEHRHYEVLVRMVNDRGHLVSPGMFVPVAERHGLMQEVDRWVIRHALAMLARMGEGGAGVYLFINLSGLSFRDEELPAYIRGQLLSNGIEPRRICFEVTETAAVAQLATGVRFMRDLQALGCKFALDDFGSGMSSFVYLKTLPVDYLKIDGAFVRNMVHDPVDEAFVETIHRIGRLMGKRTIAEFVESEAIRERLKGIGVDYAQGKVIGMPRPLDAVLKGL